MLMVLHEFFAANTEVVAVIPDLRAIADSLDLLCGKIEAASRRQYLYRHGAGIHKQQVKAEMRRLMADVSRKLTAFAFLANDPVLHREVRTSNSALGRMTQISLASFCRILLDRGNLSLDRAAAYGLVRQNLKDLETALQAYELALPEPRLARVEKVMATGQLATLFGEVDDLLVKSDILVEIVREVEQDFYQGYRNSRRQLIRVGHRLQMIITFLDKEIGHPLPSVLCRLSHPERPARPVISKKSAAKGSLKIKSLEGGPYLLTAVQPGYSPISQEIFVTKGEFMRVRVEMGRGEE